MALTLTIVGIFCAIGLFMCVLSFIGLVNDKDDEISALQVKVTHWKGAHDAVKADREALQSRYAIAIGETRRTAAELQALREGLSALLHPEKPCS